jgi:hypothetical protein
MNQQTDHILINVIFIKNCMKHIPVILFIMGSQYLNAQNVGIGTNLPHESAKVDISSNSQGLLIPRLTTDQRNAIVSPSAGLLVYDSTLQQLMHFQEGWKKTGDLTLPYSRTQSSSGNLFSILNTGNGRAISGFSESSYGLYGSSNTGTGVYGYSSSGYGGIFQSATDGIALAVTGKLYVTSSTGSTGSIMSVNSSGNPIWMTPSAFSVKDVGTVSQSIANGTDVAVDFTTVDYDNDSDYSIANNTFTAPTNGIYHFDAMVLWDPPTNSTGYLAISLFVGNSLHSTVRTPAFQGESASNTLSVDVKLNAGQTVRLNAYQSTGVTQNLNAASQTCRFTGRLVMKQ